ncbi:FAD binding domain-containing protein [Cohnella yongneupensis]|uniref:FAD binding domain-containing protein n=1 Tax=Cohnella yongneupensis TaxID=425006 RepID=A0ABW0R5E3_9BACL
MASEQEEIARFPSVLHPRDLAEAWTFKRLFDTEAIYVAGGTLLRTQWESGVATMPRQVIDLSSIPGLTGIAADEDAIAIGALTTLGECRNDPLLIEHYPMLVEAFKSIAAHSIRNSATIGGNIASRVGDCLPALIACRAEFEWCTGLSQLRESASEWVERLHVQSPKPSNLLTRIFLPFMNQNRTAPVKFGAYHKVGRREAFTPSVVTVAMSGSLKPDGAIKEVVIAAGGGQTIPQRMHAAEKALKGRLPDRELLIEVHGHVEKQFVPKTDPLVSDAYRRKTAANLVAAALWREFVREEGEGYGAKQID